MSTNKKLTYIRYTKNLSIESPKKQYQQIPEQATDNSLNFSQSLSGYEKTDGVLSYNIVCVISGGERKERDFLRLLIKQKEFHSLRIALKRWTGATAISNAGKMDRNKKHESVYRI